MIRRQKILALVEDYVSGLSPGEEFRIEEAAFAISRRDAYHAPSAGAIANYLKMMHDEVERIGSGKYRRK